MKYDYWCIVSLIVLLVSLLLIKVKRRKHQKVGGLILLALILSALVFVLSTLKIVLVAISLFIFP